LKNITIKDVIMIGLFAIAGTLTQAMAETETPELWLHPQARQLPSSKERRMPLAVLQDGSLMHIAREGRQISNDGGRTWSKPEPIYTGDHPGKHTGGGILFRTQKNVLILVYHDSNTRVLKWDRKTGETSDDTRNDVWVMRSTDGGLTWVDRQHLSKLHEESPYCLALIQMAELKDGSIVIPLQPRRSNPNRNVITSVTSRDEGQTWVRSETVLDIGGGGLHDGLLEPAIIGLQDGRAYMLIRTNRDWLYESFSNNGGVTWSAPKQTSLDASSSPAFLLRLNSEKVLLVWNRLALSDGSPAPRRQGLKWSREPASWQRSELSVAISSDDCKTWSQPIVVARQLKKAVAYPSAIEPRPGVIWILTRYGEHMQIEIPEEALCSSSFAPFLDLSSDTDRHVIIAAGTPEIYQGHATTALLADGKTMFAVWTTGHGGHCGPAAMSKDRGKTWQRIDDRFPPEYATWKNCPAIYRMADARGKERLFVFACGKPAPGQDRAAGMARVVSEDNGETWRVMPPLPVTCVMPMCSIMRLKDGAYLGQYNDRWPERKKIWNRVFQIFSYDGGLTWSKAELVAQHEAMNLCEPFLLRSSDNNELCAILRDNVKNALSKLIFSRDEGKTWSDPIESSWGVTGHRHHGVCLPDGRWVIAFRDTAPGSPTRNHFVVWLGTYEDIRERRPGRRIKLLHSFAGSDCGYAALELLPDGTVFATTYIKYWNDNRKHSVVGVRIKPEDLTL
jgi:hypothetical protein